MAHLRRDSSPVPTEHGADCAADTDRGTQTCAGRPGAQGHEAQDAQTYADWGVDYLKEVRVHAHAHRACTGRVGGRGVEGSDTMLRHVRGRVLHGGRPEQDSCHASGSHAEAYRQYGLMRDGLNKTGRPILFSLCGWNACVKHCPT